jgi:alpha-1,6-mannosyltransferase
VLIACHLLNALLVDRIAAGAGLARPGVAALAYGWNPLLLYETAGNGHNDIVMLTALLLAFWLLLPRRPGGLALPSVTLAVLAKYVAALWLPVFLFAWLPVQVRERRWRAVLASGAICAGLVVACFAPFWGDGDALAGVSRQSNLYTTSLASWVIALLTERRLMIGRGVLLELIRLAAFTIVGLTLLIARPRPGDLRSLVRAIFDVSLVYLLVGALWFQPWYLVPLVGLAPLVQGWRRAVAIIYALGATGSYVFYFYIWPALDWTPDKFVVQSWAVGVAHGPTWVALFAVAGWWMWRAVGRTMNRPDAKDAKTRVVERGT